MPLKLRLYNQRNKIAIKLYCTDLTRTTTGNDMLPGKETFVQNGQAIRKERQFWSLINMYLRWDYGLTT